MATSNRGTRHDLPLALLVWGILYALCILLHPITARSSFTAHFANQSDLQSIKGTVSDVSRSTRRGLTTTHLTVEGYGQTYHLQPVARSEKLYDWRPGDRILARVTPPDRITHTQWCWELWRNGTQMISYQDTLNYELEERREFDATLPGFAGIALVCLSCAVLLRKYFGAWTEKGFLALQASRTPKP